MLQNHIWELFFSGEVGKYPSEHLIRFVANNFYKNDRRSTRILEVGCGPGANIWYISREGFDPYGIDGSPTAIKKAIKRLGDENLIADFKVGDINKLPYENNFFDAIIDNECIYSNTYYDSNLIMQEIKRVLKKDGLFFSRTFAEDTYIGENSKQIGYLAFEEATDGPMAHHGFIRLTDKRIIDELYGKYFMVISLDKMTYTRNNGEYTISEWIIISKKN